MSKYCRECFQEHPLLKEDPPHSDSYICLDCYIRLKKELWRDQKYGELQVLFKAIIATLRF